MWDWPHLNATVNDILSGAGNGEEMTCKCVECPECDGFGSIWISFSGKYMGKYRCDDFDEMATCPECSGYGLFELCDECRFKLEEEDNE